MKYTLTRQIETQEFDIDVEIDYTFHAEHKGARDSIGGVRNAGPPLEPDEPAYIEITSAKDASGVEWELTDQEQKDIEDEISEKLSEEPEPEFLDW